MPMIPGPIAGVVYTAIKVGAYAAYAHGLNRVFNARVPAWKFAATRYAFGFLCGLLAVGAAAVFSLDSDAGHHGVFAVARIIAWTAALSIFFRQAESAALRLLAALFGTLLSFALDAAMAALYDIPFINAIPGMAMGFC